MSDVVLTLPFPPSVNAMFAHALFTNGKTRRIKSRKYADWIAEAGCILNVQRPPRIIGPVMLSYLVQEGFDKRKRDVGNYEKAVTDLLVAHHVIEADDNTIVREIRLKWSDQVKGIHITISKLKEQKLQEQEKAA